MRRPLLFLLPLAGACLDDVILPPDPPTLDLLSNVVRVPVLKGSKPAGTAVLFGEDASQEIYPADNDTNWRATVALLPGENDVVLWSRTVDGRLSYAPTRATVVYEPNFPDPPTLDQRSPIFSPVSPVALSGTKPLGARLLLNGDEIAALNHERTWSFNLALDAEGTYSFTLLAQDARGKNSEPVDFVVVFDRTPPDVESIYPNGTPLATNGIISVVFNEPLSLAQGAADVSVVSVRNGIEPIAPSAVFYAALTRALRIAPPRGGWPASTTIVVQLDHTQLIDLAGNANPTRPADWNLSIATGDAADNTVPGGVTIASPPPLGDADGDGALELFAQAIDDRELTITGTKPPASSVTLNGIEVAPLDDATAFTTTVKLVVGENQLAFAAVSPAELLGPVTVVEATREVRPPNPPVVHPFPSTVTEPIVELSGTRDPNTTLLLDGIPVFPRGPETEWAFVADLVPGTNTRQLVARLIDEGETLLSAPVVITVEFAQVYEGNVSPDAELDIVFKLKDLADNRPISGEFETGSNNYAVDIWLEGPLDPGERCVMLNGDRQNIKYVDTVVHYKGTKTGHITPWGDEDYRNPDYLAALVTAGKVPALSAGADRRQPNGAPNAGFGYPVPIGEEEVDALDGITHPTIKADRTHTFTWRQSDQGRPVLAQGEYLVHVVWNLDRSGAWLLQNDFETCWLDANFNGIGMHRVTARMAFGDTAYELELGEATETSGPDVDQELGTLRYLDGNILFRWKP